MAGDLSMSEQFWTSPTSTVNIPLEEYIRLRQVEQNNMYLMDRFKFIDDRLREHEVNFEGFSRDMDKLNKRVDTLEVKLRDLQYDVKKG